MAIYVSFTIFQERWFLRIHLLQLRDIHLRSQDTVGSLLLLYLVSLFQKHLTSNVSLSEAGFKGFRELLDSGFQLLVSSDQLSHSDVFLFDPRDVGARLVSTVHQGLKHASRALGAFESLLWTDAEVPTEVFLRVQISHLSLLVHSSHVRCGQGVWKWLLSSLQIGFDLRLSLVCALRLLSFCATLVECAASGVLGGLPGAFDELLAVAGGTSHSPQFHSGACGVVTTHIIIRN